MSASELLAQCRKQYPQLRLAQANNNAIGEFVPAVGRFVPVYMLAITGQWVYTGEFETFVNGQPAYKPEDWKE